MGILAVLKWTERLGARRECTKDGWPTLLKSIHNRIVGSLEKACSCSVVHSEALSQLRESRLVIHQVMRADVTELKFIWLFCGYRESRGSLVCYLEQLLLTRSGRDLAANSFHVGPTGAPQRSVRCVEQQVSAVVCDSLRNRATIPTRLPFSRFPKYFLSAPRQPPQLCR